MDIYQIWAILKALFQECYNTKAWKGIILSPLLLFGVVVFVIKDLIFTGYFDTNSSLFIITMALIWIGIFNSITEICGNKAIIKVDAIQGMKIPSFIIGNVIYQFVLCAFQTLICTLMMHFFVTEIPADGLYTKMILEYYVIGLALMFSADMLGMLISSLAKSNEQAMTIMPFVLVCEMIFSNALFDLPETFHNVANYFTTGMISRWGMDAFGTTSHIIKFTGEVGSEFPKLEFTYSTEHLKLTVLVLLGWSLVYILLTVIRLLRIRKERLF